MHGDHQKISTNTKLKAIEQTIKTKKPELIGICGGSASGKQQFQII